MHVDVRGQVSEAFLQRVMALYTAAHYKNQVCALMGEYKAHD